MRSVCLRSTDTEETPLIDEVFGIHVEVYGVAKEQFAASVAQTTHRKRSHPQRVGRIRRIPRLTQGGRGDRRGREPYRRNYRRLISGSTHRDNRRISMPI